MSNLVTLDRKVAVGRSVRETAMKASSDRVEQKQSEHRDAGRHHDLFGGTQCSVADRDLHEEDTREEQDGQDWRSAVERPGGGLSEHICNINIVDYKTNDRSTLQPFSEQSYH